STQKVVIKLFPRKDLVGSEFFGMIRISLGVNSAEKNIKLVFLPQNSCPIGMESTILETENKEKLLIVSRLENKKQEEAKISFEKISGLPNSWQIIPEDIKSIGPFEEKLHRIFLEPAEEFNGSAELAYNCDGFVQTKKLNFSFKPTQQDFLTGVFSLFSFNIEGSLVINVILAAIAAVLLIAFISRLVKKFSAPDMMS
ncbi:MAG: hypothetical protein HYW50_04235, partial [Candidatus Diapherotrites archaeon]|nr:hypothetical protein [Candidatus Diapherotrites archaeon]